MTGEARREAGPNLLSGSDQIDEPPSSSELSHVDRLASLGRMTAGIVHELRQPATFVMIGQTAVLRALSDLEEALDAADTGDLARPRELARKAVRLTSEALSGMEQLHRLLCSVRDFARPGSGMLEPVDINELVTAACSFARHELCTCGEVAMDLGPLPEVRLDPLKLTQVLINLLINAADAVAARPEGRRRVRIQTRVDCDRIRIEIEDDGCGIPESIRARIFEPFFSTKRGAGSGLGLWLTADIVKGLRGSIDFESKPGIGTSFVVRLPIEEAQDP